MYKKWSEIKPLQVVGRPKFSTIDFPFPSDNCSKVAHLEQDILKPTEDSHYAYLLQAHLVVSDAARRLNGGH